MTTTLTPGRPTTLLAVSADTWRAVDGAGRALGHIRVEPTADGDRYRAMRFHAATRSFRTIGEFWTQQGAVDCLRYGG